MLYLKLLHFLKGKPYKYLYGWKDLQRYLTFKIQPSICRDMAENPKQEYSPLLPKN